MIRLTLWPEDVPIYVNPDKIVMALERSIDRIVDDEKGIVEELDETAYVTQLRLEGMSDDITVSEDVYDICDIQGILGDQE